MFKHQDSRQYRMLIPLETVAHFLRLYKIQPRGALHVGAHECEERHMYHTVFNLDDETILWVDGNEDLVKKNKANGIPLCIHSVLDETAHEATFQITNNGQSSSLLELGTHKESYPYIVVTERRTVQTETLEQMFGRIQKNPAEYNIWNFDIQGSELAVFRGSPELLQYCDMLVTEVNTAHVYKDCGLLTELDSFLKSHGLHRMFTQMTNEKWGDALYVRKSQQLHEE